SRLFCACAMAASMNLSACEECIAPILKGVADWESAKPSAASNRVILSCRPLRSFLLKCGPGCRGTFKSSFRSHSAKNTLKLLQVYRFDQMMCESSIDGPGNILGC